MILTNDKNEATITNVKWTLQLAIDGEAFTFILPQIECFIFSSLVQSWPQEWNAANRKIKEEVEKHDIYDIGNRLAQNYY